MELPPKAKGRHRTDATHPNTMTTQHSTDVHNIVLGDTGTVSLLMAALFIKELGLPKLASRPHPDCTTESFTLSSDKQPKDCYVPHEILIGM
jgi:hypothetical protein